MKPNKTVLATAAAAALALFAGNASAALVITEVDAAGSGASYAADWSELTNTGASTVDLTGWKVDDSSASFALAVAFRGVTSIGAGKSIVFLEGNATGTTDATIGTNFIAAWFGGNAPAGLTLGYYGGSGVGLSTSAGDGVAVFDSTGSLVTSVTFGATPTGATLDNKAGATGLISTASVAGVNGAFLASGEIGSPGNVSPVPVPAAIWLLGSGIGLLGAARRRKSV